MSAKSSTFAAKLKKMRDLRHISREMTHTCYRCGHSTYAEASKLHKQVGILCCTQGCTIWDEHKPTKCPKWKPEKAITLLEEGALDMERKMALLQILQHREKKGTF